MLTTVMDARRSVHDAGLDEPAADPERPTLEEFGLLRYRGEWVALSSSEERMIRPLLAGWGRVVHTRDLAASVWPDHPARATSLHTLAHRLRRRVRPLGLAVETIRGRGFLMEPLRPDDTTTLAAPGGTSHEGPT